MQTRLQQRTMALSAAMQTSKQVKAAATSQILCCADPTADLTGVKEGAEATAAALLASSQRSSQAGAEDTALVLALQAMVGCM